MTVVSAILVSSMGSLSGRKSSEHPPNLITSISPGHRIQAVVKWDHVGRILMPGIVICVVYNMLCMHVLYPSVHA